MEGKEVANMGKDEKRMVLFNAIKNSLYPAAKDDSVLMVLDYCGAANLDPMTKPVHIVPMNVKDAKTGKYEWRDVVMPGIELYRTKASRTREHAGTSEPEFGPIIEKEFTGKDKNGKAVTPVKISFPEWCKVTVRRLVNSRVVEFTAKEYWMENYSTQGRDSDIPNAMWQKRPFGQLSKCAESQALRKGFPEIGAQPTADEMYGKTIDSDAIDNAPAGMKPAVEAPRAKKTFTVYKAESDTHTDVDSLADWYKANEANFKKDLSTADQKKLNAHILARKKELTREEVSVEMVSCPDRNGDQVPVSYCDEECAKRVGCPAHG